MALVNKFRLQWQGSTEEQKKKTDDLILLMQQNNELLQEILNKPDVDLQPIVDRQDKANLLLQQIADNTVCTCQGIASILEYLKGGESEYEFETYGDYFVFDFQGVGVSTSEIAIVSTRDGSFCPFSLVDCSNSYVKDYITLSYDSVTGFASLVFSKMFLNLFDDLFFTVKLKQDGSNKIIELSVRVPPLYVDLGDPGNYMGDVPLRFGIYLNNNGWGNNSYTAITGSFKSVKIGTQGIDVVNSNPDFWDKDGYLYFSVPVFWKTVDIALYCSFDFDFPYIASTDNRFVDIGFSSILDFTIGLTVPPLLKNLSFPTSVSANSDSFLFQAPYKSGFSFDSTLASLNRLSYSNDGTFDPGNFELVFPKNTKIERTVKGRMLSDNLCIPFEIKQEGSISFVEYELRCTPDFQTPYDVPNLAPDTIFDISLRFSEIAVYEKGSSTPHSLPVLVSQQDSRGDVITCRNASNVSDPWYFDVKYVCQGVGTYNVELQLVFLLPDGTQVNYNKIFVVHEVGWS